MSPHIEVANVTEGIFLKLRNEWIVLPPDMARDLALLLLEARDRHDPTRVDPLPTITPKGDPVV